MSSDALQKLKIFKVAKYGKWTYQYTVIAYAWNQTQEISKHFLPPIVWEQLSSFIEKNVKNLQNFVHICCICVCVSISLFAFFCAKAIKQFVYVMIFI